VDDCEKEGPALMAYAVHMKPQQFVVFKHRPIFSSINIYQTQFAFLSKGIAN